MKNIINLNKKNISHNINKNAKHHRTVKTSEINIFFDIIKEGLDKGFSSRKIISALSKTFDPKTDLLLIHKLIFLIRRELNSTELILKEESGKNTIAKINEVFENIIFKLIEDNQKDCDKHNKTTTKLIRGLKIVKDDLQKQLDALHQFIKSAPVGIVGCDSQFNVELWNPMAYRLSGYKPSEMFKKNVTRILSEHSRLLFSEKLSGPFTVLRRMKLQIKMKDGGDFPAWVSINKIKYPDYDKLHYVISFGDLKNEKLIRTQMDRINQLGAIARLTDAIMHDVRNPVNSIALNLDVLQQFLSKEQLTNQQIPGIIEKLDRQIEQLRYNLNQYLGYSQLAAVNPSSINIRKEMEELLMDVRQRTIDKRIEVNYSGPNNDVLIVVDWIQLKRALTNIIQNAEDSITESGLIKIEAKEKGSRFVIRIIDTGSGMEHEVIENIFEPYFSTRNSGTGLGLFIAREIIRGHNGRIYCTSKKSKGTKFTISIPL